MANSFNSITIFDGGLYFSNEFGVNDSGMSFDYGGDICKCSDLLTGSSYCGFEVVVANGFGFGFDDIEFVIDFYASRRT